MLISIFDEPDEAVCFCFPENIFAVGFNRAFAEKEGVGDLFIAEFLFY